MLKCIGLDVVVLLLGPYFRRHALGLEMAERHFGCTSHETGHEFISVLVWSLSVHFGAVAKIYDRNPKNPKSVKILLHQLVLILTVTVNNLQRLHTVVDFYYSFHDKQNVVTHLLLFLLKILGIL